MRSLVGGRKVRLLVYGVRGRSLIVDIGVIAGLCGDESIVDKSLICLITAN